MSPEEKVASLHARMAVLRRTQERRKTAAIGAVCAGLTLCLLVLVFGAGTALHHSSADSYSGTMLFENAGGYALTAVLAFMVGMAATLFCLRWRANTRKKQQENTEEEQKKERKTTIEGGD